MNIEVVIAAHNEAGSIADVIHKVQQALPDAPILVVDDGSRDRTSVLAAEAGARVLRIEVNGGKGAAMRRGIAETTADWVLFLDADGQDDPAEIPVLLAAAGEGVSMVNGSRFLGDLRPGSIHPANRVGNVTLTRLFAVLFGQPITDSQAGFRLLNGPVVRAMNLRCREYEFETEVLAKALKGGGRVIEVPVTRYPRSAGRTDFRRVRNGLRILATMLRERAVPG